MPPEWVSVLWLLFFPGSCWSCTEWLPDRQWLLLLYQVPAEHPHSLLQHLPLQINPWTALRVVTQLWGAPLMMLFPDSFFKGKFCYIPCSSVCGWADLQGMPGCIIHPVYPPDSLQPSQPLHCRLLAQISPPTAPSSVKFDVPGPQPSAFPHSSYLHLFL